MSAIESQNEFAVHFETLQLETDTLQIGHGETILPTAVPRMDEPLARLRTLPRLSVAERASNATTYPDLSVKGTIGEGGMGLVRLATQVALDREVAVKTLRAKADAAGPKLLQEAYVTGKLEHPNIIPIYTLGRDDEGVPLIVMKRIEGVSWLDVIEDPARAPREEPADLHWHLDILVNVCDALRFAHSHAIIHRDVKPENVMIGAFGEVYLLDWGIAISIAEHETEHSLIPHRSQSRGIAGTPSYMAPEMTDYDASRHDARTDIYLVGACLHEVLTGTTRHCGDTLFDVMRSAFESAHVAYDESVPSELAAIANRAMARDIDDRFASVDALRTELLDFIQHRASIELAHAAESALHEARLRLLKGDRTDADDAAISELFTECRFATRQSLKEWSSNDLAIVTQRECRLDLVRFALQRADLLGATTALAEVEEPPAELVAEVDELERRLAQERQEFAHLRKVAHDLDLRVGTRSRSWFALVIGCMWAATCFWAEYRHIPGSEYATDGRGLVGSTFRVVAIAALGTFLFRRRLFSNVANRRMLYLLGIVLLGIVFSRALAVQFEIAEVHARSLEICLYGMAAMTAALISDLRILASGLVYFAVACSALVWPGHLSLILGFGHLLAFGWTAWLWSPAQMRKAVTS